MRVKANRTVLLVELPFFVIGTTILWTHYDFWLALGVLLIAIGASVRPLD